MGKLMMVEMVVALTVAIGARAEVAADAAAKTAAEPRTVLSLPAGKGNSRNSEGDFAVLKDGRIFFAYSKFVSGTGDDHDQCVIAARTSSDKGETWSDDRIVARNEIDPKGNVMSVSLLRLRDGRLAMFYACKLVATNRVLVTRMLLRVSSDEGLTWRRRNLETEYDAKNSYHYWYCYTAVLELDDRILAAYCAENNLKNLRIKSIPLAWLP